ncbi:Uncharacterized conserved protein YjdB, contains Ig-like domain [Tessaracoccus bendigoensis DSM 12906]|uniref:Uncharacterized conserved protein YjdB, contains Ig-like domain n=1 Tax=Tessaracoccus bendigoensis DSM 12906 TaxID=1123357 RepID=A0A1M6FGZ0_9ACTN|nr:Ig-like domain-containing protein [Tessaracoccus bendigoensis]SHI96862.1 Uncharacterized conserved protein YjdB, contains Ig-like domain [Tessaracoccus bendigoensis DSM 12906]
MSPKRILIPLVTALAVLFGTFLTAAPAKADTLISDQQSITRAATWIAGEWDAGRYSRTDAGLLADGVMALSSAGSHHGTIDQMLTTLRQIGPAYVTSQGGQGLAKLILTADMAGVADPAHFLGTGRDLATELIALIEARNVPQAWGGYLSVIALARIDRLDEVSAAGMDYLMSRMFVSGDGGFGWASGQAKGDPDYTGVGVSAMLLLTRSNQVSSTVKVQAQSRLDGAKAWAANPANRRTDAQGDHFWIASPNGTDGASSNSTGILASALNEAGVSTESPRRAMKREQAATRSQSAWSATRMGSKDDLRATVQAIFAVTGTGYATAKLRPAVKVTRITLPATLAVTAGRSQALTATVTPANATDKSLTWATSDAAVATVNTNGTVTGVKAGTATVTATAADGSGVRASTRVTVAKAAEPFDVYTTPGTHNYNGRLWRTTCEKYSVTERCRTEIQATTVSQVNGRFVQSTGWAFNNLTYKASARSAWTTNPLGGYGKRGAKISWTASDGRTWRTECDTALTGANGCRSFATARIIESYTTSNGSRAFRWTTKEIFNNMVRFN